MSCNAQLLSHPKCYAILSQPRHHSDLVPFDAETTVLANDLKKEDFKVISLHPGFVATDMGANASDLMSAIRPGKLLLLAALSNHGRFSGPVWHASVYGIQFA